MNTVAQNIAEIKKQITPAQLLVVTKTRSTEDIRSVIEQGVKMIGENKAQEVFDKYDQSLLDDLRKQKVELHFIGHLQTNKVKKILQYCDVIQSVDSLKLAEKINQAAKNMDKKVKIFLQLNLTREEQKYGFIITETNLSYLKQIIAEIKILSNLDLIGFMCMGVLDNNDKTRQAFRSCKELSFHLKLPETSMGMSDDYQIAVSEGSTIVRIGSKIFS